MPTDSSDSALHAQTLLSALDIARRIWRIICDARLLTTRVNEALTDSRQLREKSPANKKVKLSAGAARMRQDVTNEEPS
jgi:hypothetical protein